MQDDDTDYSDDDVDNDNDEDSDGDMGVVMVKGSWCVVNLMMEGDNQAKKIYLFGRNA